MHAAGSLNRGGPSGGGAASAAKAAASRRKDQQRLKSMHKNKDRLQMGGGRTALGEGEGGDDDEDEDEDDGEEKVDWGGMFKNLGMAKELSNDGRTSPSPPLQALCPAKIVVTRDALLSAGCWPSMTSTRRPFRALRRQLP